MGFTQPQRFASGLSGFFGMFPDYGLLNLALPNNATVEQVQLFLLDLAPDLLGDCI